MKVSLLGQRQQQQQQNNSNNNNIRKIANLYTFRKEIKQVVDVQNLQAHKLSILNVTVLLLVITNIAVVNTTVPIRIARE